MQLKEFLLNETKPGEIVIFREGGWQVGMTRIDNEDLFTFSLNPVMLELYDVICYARERRPWTTKEILVLDIKRSEDVCNARNR